MKDYIQCKYLEQDQGRQWSQEQFRQIVKEAWDLGFDGNDLEILMDSMPRRIKIVYDTDGGYVNYLSELNVINNLKGVKSNSISPRGVA